MKVTLKTLAVAACLAISTCAYAQEGFIRPELSYNFAKLSANGNSWLGLKDAVGYGVAGGATFGAQNEHEVGLSIGFLDFTPTSSLPASSITGKIKSVPVMANYRYYFGAKTASLRFYLAPSIGYSSDKVDYTLNVSGGSFHHTSSGTDFTWGAGLGVLFKVADKVDVDVGYRYVAVDYTDAKAKIGALFAGVNFRF